MKRGSRKLLLFLRWVLSPYLPLICLADRYGYGVRKRQGRSDPLCRGVPASLVLDVLFKIEAQACTSLARPLRLDSSTVITSDKEVTVVGSSSREPSNSGGSLFLSAISEDVHVIPFEPPPADHILFDRVS